MTNEEFTAWLKKGGMFTVLVEVDTSTSRYLSTVPYTTLPTDTPANRVYSPVIAGGVAFTEKLPLDGSPTLSVGDIEIHNEDGSLDSWLNDVWVNKAIRVYIGDITWPRSDFQLIFSGVVADLYSRSATRLNITLRDKMQRLNTPLTETVLGGATTNKDRLIPLAFGECHNVEPLLIDPALLKYQVHQGQFERNIEVRDNGVPVTVNTNLTDGTFTLTKAQAGTVTASVQGTRDSTSYPLTVADIVKTIVKNYGKQSDRLTDGDIDLVQFNAFNSLHPQPVGLYASDRLNVIEACQSLASSVGAQVAMSRTGLLKLLKIALPPAGTPVVVGPSDYVAKSLEISERPSVVAGVKLGYCKNWTTQSNLDTGIPAAHKTLFQQEYLPALVKDNTVATTYKLNTEPTQQDTLLLTEADAVAEANRRLALWKEPRMVYKFVGFAHLLTLELGQALTLVSPRFDLSAGKTGVIVGLQSDWITRRVTVEVLV